MRDCVNLEVGVISIVMAVELIAMEAMVAACRSYVHCKSHSFVVSVTGSDKE